MKANDPSNSIGNIDYRKSFHELKSFSLINTAEVRIMDFISYLIATYYFKKFYSFY
jgi:hypothetical protein